MRKLSRSLEIEQNYIRAILSINILYYVLRSIHV